MSGDGPPDADRRDPSVPRLQIDDLLHQFIDRAAEIVTAQERLSALLEANRLIIGDLDLPTVLRRIVRAACHLVDARYGAIGVLAPDGKVLEQFIHHGVDDETADAIGHLPTGQGLLGALIVDPRPVRLERLAEDPRSIGFPEHHPPMSSFLGVPIRVRDVVFGNLYLAEASAGTFSADDEQIVVALAATAGVAIDNARLFTESRSRQRALEASTLITRQLLAAEGEEPLAVIAGQLRHLADADVISVVLPTADGTRLLVEVATGIGAEDLLGYTYPAAGSLAAQAISTGLPVNVADAGASGTSRVHLTAFAQVGPVMVVPLGSDRPRGALTVGRARGRRPFQTSDMDIAMTFAGHAALALELADARETQQRVELLEDRDRIARDLHDHVIQRLFAAGLTLQGISARVGGEQGDRIARTVASIDETIVQIRTSIFQLRGPLGPTTGGLRTRLLTLINELSEDLQLQPGVRLAGPLDSVVPDALVDDLLAVVREALTNVAKHARASRVDVTLTAQDGQCIIEVVDDGVGIGNSQRRSGVANLTSRAHRHGGTCTIEAVHNAVIDQPEGTRLRWQIPLD